MNNFNYLSNASSSKLYIILSGLSGGKEESLVKDLSTIIIKGGSILSIQFCNDHFYKNNKLDEVENLTFEYCFKRLDEEIKYAKNSHGVSFNEIVFVGHSFSALISIYYVYRTSKKKKNLPYKLVLLDKSNSIDIVEFMKTDQKDIIFSKRLIKYLENNDEVEMLKELRNKGIAIKNIEAGDLDANHDFKGKKIRKTLANFILNL